MLADIIAALFCIRTLGHKTQF